MSQLIGFSLRVFLVPGIQVGEDTFTAEVAEGDHQHKGSDQHRNNQGDHAAVDTTKKQDAHRDRRDHHEGTHIRFGQQQHTDNRQRCCHRPDRLDEVLPGFHLAHHIAGGIHRDRQLGQLGWLEIDHPQRQPAARAVDAFADKGNQHDHQHDQRGDEKPWRGALPIGHRQLHDGQRYQQRQQDRQHMAQEEMGWQVMIELGVVGHRDRRRINHQQAQAQQGEHDPNQGLVKPCQLGRLTCADIDPIAHRDISRRST